MATAPTVGILLFDDAEELDFAGPWEVLTSAAARREGTRVVTIAEKREIRCAKGLRVLADCSLEDAPRLDVLLVPGGMGTRREVDNRALMEWLAKTAAGCSWVTSVCTGSLLLWGAGLVAGKRITSHWAFIDEFRERAGSDAEILKRVRYVRDGNVVTAAGVSAGIDMALWLVGQIWDPTFAREVQRYIEYDPAPPYSAEV